MHGVPKRALETVFMVCSWKVPTLLGEGGNLIRRLTNGGESSVNPRSGSEKALSTAVMDR
ncbi:hypothetical protein A2U01_0004436 [Trifolium medium]|uniref:Uncharacterized protein n=1 Tax=Trifolium medium TaxID=97028 RepID=A0A392M807_9FABA|nr:hypothetical protein [Trifolium medium]